MGVTLRFGVRDLANPVSRPIVVANVKLADVTIVRPRVFTIVGNKLRFDVRLRAKVTVLDTTGETERLATNSMR